MIIPDYRSEKVNNCDLCCRDKSFENYYVFKRGRKQELYSCVNCWENHKTQLVGENWTWSYHTFPGPAFFVNAEDEEMGVQYRDKDEMTWTKPGGFKNTIALVGKREEVEKEKKDDDKTSHLTEDEKKYIGSENMVGLYEEEIKKPNIKLFVPIGGREHTRAMINEEDEEEEEEEEEEENEPRKWIIEDDKTNWEIPLACNEVCKHNM